MIAVIADDLTGAAEIGGLGLKYNLKVEINTEVNLHSNADLLIISTDTRSMPEQEAVATIKKVSSELASLKPQLIFKKVDSVLRGHVIPEIKAQLQAFNLQKALIVPANPNLGRTIVNGTYLLNGQPIHQSSFSADPEFAITSSSVLEMVRDHSGSVCVQQHFSPLTETDIIIGEAETASDLNCWAKYASQSVLLAGAAGFFSALLEKNSLSQKTTPEVSEEKNDRPVLFICGTTFHKSRVAIKTISYGGGPVSYMPQPIIISNEPDSGLYQQWANRTIELLQKNNQAIIAIDAESVEKTAANATSLRAKTAKLIPLLLQHIHIGEIFIEGGATASAVLKALNIKKLFPLKELAPGVIQMSTDLDKTMRFTLKPGSYHWPPGTWNFSDT